MIEWNQAFPDRVSDCPKLSQNHSPRPAKRCAQQDRMSAGTCLGSRSRSKRVATRGKKSRPNSLFLAPSAPCLLKIPPPSPTKPATTSTEAPTPAPPPPPPPPPPSNAKFARRQRFRRTQRSRQIVHATRFIATQPLLSRPRNGAPPLLAEPTNSCEMVDALADEGPHGYASRRKRLRNSASYDRLAEIDLWVLAQMGKNGKGSDYYDSALFLSSPPSRD